MKKLYLLPFFLALFLAACQKEGGPQPNNAGSGCNTPVVNSGKVYTKGERLMLWAGEDSTTHFDITGWALETCQLYDYGYNRETISALADPEYRPIHQAPEEYDDEEQTIFLKEDGKIKVYPYTLMTYHEVINEVSEGAPIMIAYCFLADLAAVYTRVYCEKEFTFAVSGYTYADENIWRGLKAFILWDRETESLWWPLIDSGVSGPMKGVGLRKHNEDKWGYMTWGELKANHPDALVLQTKEGWTPPAGLPKYSCADLQCCED